MLKVLGCLTPLVALSFGAIAAAAPPSVQTDLRQPVAKTGSKQPDAQPSNVNSKINSKINSTDFPQLKNICSAKDLSILEQGLAPPVAQSSPLPQEAPLALPQQPSSVAVQQLLGLELPTAIRYAFDRNPDLQVTKLQLRRSCEQLKQARAANYPTLAVVGSVSRTDGGSFDPLNQSYGNNTSSQVQAQQVLLQEQTQAQQQLQQLISQLQQRFQQTPTLVQTSTLQQQIDQLQQSANTAAVLSTPLDIPPLTANAVVLPLSSLGGGADSSGSGGSGSSNFANGALNLNYRIYTGGQRSASIQAAEKQVTNAALAVQVQSQQLRQAVTSRYIDLQQTQSLIGIANSAVTSNQETLRITQLGEQAGIQTRYDVLQTAVALADAQQNLTQAKALFSIAQRQLVQQIGLPIAVNVTLPDATTAVRAGFWQLSLEETIILALNNRLELNQTLIQRQITELQKRITRAQQRPQIQAFASLNVADDLGDRVLGSYGYSVGVQANLNVFDGGATRAQLRQLDQTLRVLDQQFNQLKESIRFAVEQDYYTLQANATNIDTANQAVTQAQEGLRLAQLRFQAGVGTTLDVTRAQADLTQAQGNLSGTILSYNRALTSLQRDTGYAAPIQPAQPIQP
jgi:outer membrane factor, OMF family